MPASSTVQVQGLNEAIRALRQVDRMLLPGLTAAGREAAALVAEEARHRVPRRTGALAGTIRPGARRNRAVVRAGSAQVLYAGPIHYGWPARNIRPQPFLYEAADARVDAVAKLYERRVDEILTAAGF